MNVVVWNPRFNKYAVLLGKELRLTSKLIREIRRPEVPEVVARDLSSDSATVLRSKFGFFLLTANYRLRYQSLDVELEPSREAHRRWLLWWMSVQAKVFLLAEIHVGAVVPA